MEEARAGAGRAVSRGGLGTTTATLLPAVCTLLLLAGQGCSGPATPTYTEQVAAARAEKDRFFLEGADSPIPPGSRQEFLPLAYFPIQEHYVVAAALTPSEREPAMEMPTSTGRGLPPGNPPAIRALRSAMRWDSAQREAISLRIVELR